MTRCFSVQTGDQLVLYRSAKTSALQGAGKSGLTVASVSCPDLASGKVHYWHVVAHTPSADVEGPYWWFAADSSTTLGCEYQTIPASGIVPFTTQMTVTLENLYTSQTRRIAGRINVVIASGNSFSNWKSGWTNVNAGSSNITSWNQEIPALGSVIGDNVFTLEAEDVTPAPYNQPPYPPAGDTDTASCTVTGITP